MINGFISITQLVVNIPIIKVQSYSFTYFTWNFNFNRIYVHIDNHLIVMHKSTFSCLFVINYILNLNTHLVTPKNQNL